MVDLLSPTERLAIKTALKDVTDTFMKTPVTVHVAGESVDPVQEDRGDQQFTDYEILGLFEHEIMPRDEVAQTLDGARDSKIVMVTFNLEDVAAANAALIVDDVPVFDTTKDYFTVNSKKYKMVYCGVDGPIEKRNVLVVIKGKLEENYT